MTSFPIVWRSLLLVTILSGCMPKHIEQPAAWRTDQGQLGVQMDLARWYIDNGQTQEGLRILAHLRENGVSNYKLDLLQGIALHREGLFDEAELILKNVAKKSPRDAEAFAALGVLYADKENVPAAISSLQTAVELEPDNPANLNNLGFLYLCIDQYEDARSVLETAISLDGTESQYRNNLAFTLVALGNHQEALRIFRSTGSEPDARFNLGVAFERAGRPTSAVLQYEHAVNISPQHELANDALSRLRNEIRLNPE